MIVKLKEEYNRLTGKCICEFLCDSEDEINTLPDCSAGSTAIVGASGLPAYIKNASEQWVKV